jgi:hypothetical protein
MGAGVVAIKDRADGIRPAGEISSRLMQPKWASALRPLPLLE